MLCWQKPEPGVIKLNVDGSRSGNSGKIGAGGVIRNDIGSWIKGFQVNLGIGDVLDAELWGLYYGLKLAIDNNMDNLEIESDSAILVKLVLDSDISVHPLGSIVSCCRALMGRLNLVSLKHIYRECNMVADSLAKNSLNHEHGVVEFDSPPVHSSQAFLADIDGIPRGRTVAVTTDDPI